MSPDPPGSGADKAERLASQMSKRVIRIKTKAASVSEISAHLVECSPGFIPPLDQSVDIQDYASKIFEKSITFEAWSNNSLVGLLAAYLNDTRTMRGYITNVSVTKAHMGEGIASRLLRRCISYAKRHRFREIRLEVHRENDPAIQLYRKFGFTEVRDVDQTLLMRLVISSDG